MHLKPAPTKVFLVPQLCGVICVVRVRNVFPWAMAEVSMMILSGMCSPGLASPQNTDSADLLNRYNNVRDVVLKLSCLKFYCIYNRLNALQ